MLAMAFIAFMLLFMVAAILQVTKLYVKGSAIRQINQTGRQVVDEVADSIRNGSSVVYLSGNNRLCAGDTSYVWNGTDVSGNPTTGNKFAIPDQNTPLRFVAVQDPGGTLCSNPTAGVTRANSTDLVGPEVAVMKFTVDTAAAPLYTLSLVLSTAGSNVVLTGQSTPTTFACAPDNQFCAFGDFTTTVYMRKGGQQ